MNTCGTCKYFGNTEAKVDAADPGGGDGVFVHAFIGEDAKYFPCLRYFADKETAKAKPVDASGYFAAICVKDDFGCVDWEQA